MNSVCIVGRITSDLELRYTPSGVAVVELNVAVDLGRKDASGKSMSDFFTVVSWREEAENAAKHLVKGQRVSVKGRLENDVFQTQAGEKRVKTKIISERLGYLDKPRSAEGGAHYAEPQRRPVVQQEAPADVEDDLPF